MKDVPINSMALHDEGDGNAQMAAVGDDNYFYERTGPESWERTKLPTEATLFDLSLGSPDLIVGTGGTVLERERTEAATQLGGGRETPEEPKKQPADDDVDAPDPPDELDS